jgi:hypothetical protein
MKLGKSFYTLVLGMPLWCSLASAQITCSSGSCVNGFVPLFTTSGSNAQVADSVIEQFGSEIYVSGNVTATGPISSSEFEVGGRPFAFGSYANQNAFLGFAGNSATTGTGNTAAGLNALENNTAGYMNTAAGWYALGYNTTGSYNAATGVSALVSNTTGSYNTAVGMSAGGSITIGTYNTAIGYNSGGAGSLFNTTTIGANAQTNENDTLILGGTGEYAVTVGIGTINPYYDYALDIDTTDSNGLINGGVVVNASGGNLYLGMTQGTHKFRVDTNGTVYADGGLYASGADFAESVAVRGKRSQYEPGDVLEIDQKAKRHLTLANHPYATLVAGIYSTKPGLLASPHHIDDESFRSGEVPLAVVGIVPCKVTAENGPIAAGDLLVTSSHAGYAMKGTDRRRLVGAVVGKALEPLPAGEGVIEILVTLQ